MTLELQKKVRVMSKKANPAIIGFFVLIALTLAVGAIITLGAGKLFKETKSLIMYFEGDLSGLDVGAPVEYKGVRIGSVTDIRLKFYSKESALRIPVTVELDLDRVNYVGAKTDGQMLPDDVKEGMRAQLQSQSLVTGKLKISIVDRPKTKKVLIGLPGDPEEVPTIPTLIESFADTLGDLPLQDIVMNVNTTLQEIADFVGSDEVTAVMEELNETLKALQGISSKTDFLLQENSPFRAKLSDAVTDISQAAKSVHLLADQLEQHPESLLKGKAKEGK